MVIDHRLSTGKVLATFVPSAPCHNQIRTRLIDSRLIVTPVSGNDPKLSIEDGIFMSCTGDKYMVDACGTAVWESKTRNTMVSPDGNTVISGERYFEWFDWDGVQDEKYVNCRRVPIA